MSDAASSPPVLVDRLEHDIVVLTLNRRHAVNSVSFEMWDAMSQALDTLERETPARGLILTGSGDFFCIGGDVKNGPARGEGALASATRLEMGQRLIQRLRRLPMPVAAAVEGGAYGFGWALAMACDVMFVAEDVKFGAPFIEFGTTPDGGISWFLTRRLGRHRAAELIFSGRTIDAAEADLLGLVSRVVKMGTALSEARAFLTGIGHGNRHAAELAKRLLHGAEEDSLEANHSLELAYCSICQNGEEVARAKAAFIAKSDAARAAKARG